MTLVNWNPMVEPSWMPGAYHVPGTTTAAAGTRRDKAGCGSEQQQQQHGAGKANGKSMRFVLCFMLPCPSVCAAHISTV